MATTPDDKCPVDHKSREAWLKAAENASSQLPPNHPIPSASPSPSGPTVSTPHARLLKTRPLAQDRETSTIPRAPISPPSTTPNPSSPLAAPSNHEIESGASTSGNWIYPSERMFFDAMKRKQYDPRAEDMKTIIPIHNAVNERAWAQIKAWEGRFGWVRDANKRCGGPRLASFRGDSSKLTPKARLNGLLGYQKPFDRHDWVVERCGTGDGVEYVIDFYKGRDMEGKSGKSGLSFYLDVRPKLNTWEGCRMRLLSLLGW